MVYPHLSESYRSIPSSSLFLYGWRERFDARTLVAEFRYFARKAGVDLHSIEYGSWCSDLRHLTPRFFDRRLADGLIPELDFLSMTSYFDKSDKQTDIFCVSYNQERFGGQFSQMMLTQHDDVFRHQMLQDFLQRILKRITPLYGYTVDFSLFFAPSYFAHGMLSRNWHAMDEAGAWQEAYSPALGRMDHTKGKFRHVFRMNVVSPAHMENKIGGKLFARWVAEPGHGRLEQWKEDVWVWFVPREDRVRCATVLQFNGLLTAPEGFERELMG